MASGCLAWSVSSGFSRGPLKQRFVFGADSYLQQLFYSVIEVCVGDDASSVGGTWKEPRKELCKS